MKIIVTTGGTGGHIYPALALCDALMKDDSSNEILFIGNSDRMETTIVPEAGYSFLGIESPRFNEANDKIAALSKLRKAYKKCIGIVSNYNPDIVIGFGGYVSVPVLLAAKYLKIPTLIHEQNSIAGLANKAVSKFVDKVCCQYETASKQFSKRKVTVVGNPRESKALNFIKSKNIIKSFGLDIKKKTLCIVMGSLGASSVNDLMIEILQEMKNKDYNVIYVTGKVNYDNVKEKIQDSDNVKIVPYIDQFNVVGNCDLVISRAGATSCCEYMALGIPSIFIPSPFVPNNHQYFNAKAMFDNGASTYILQKNITKETLLKTVDELIENDEMLEYMSKQSLSMAHLNCCDDMIKIIKELCNGNTK